MGGCLKYVKCHCYLNRIVVFIRSICLVLTKSHDSIIVTFSYRFLLLSQSVFDPSPPPTHIQSYIMYYKFGNLSKVFKRCFWLPRAKHLKKDFWSTCLCVLWLDQETKNWRYVAYNYGKNSIVDICCLKSKIWVVGWGSNHSLIHICHVACSEGLELVNQSLQ